MTLSGRDLSTIHGRIDSVRYWQAVFKTTTNHLIFGFLIALIMGGSIVSFAKVVLIMQMWMFGIPLALAISLPWWVWYIIIITWIFDFARLIAS